MKGSAALLGVLLLGVTGGCAPAATRPSTPRPSPHDVEALANALSGMIWPLPVRRPGEVTSPFGPRGVRHHDGLDIDGRTGDPVFAARDGRVTFSGWKNGYGNTVILEHGEGVTTLYGHASELFVGVGHSVTRGQVIAAVGATGNARGDHLHFEIRWRGTIVDPTLLLPRMAGR